MSNKTDSLSVSLLPMTSIDNSSVNLQFIENGISKLDPSTRLLCLPENSLFLNLDKSPIPKEEAFSRESMEIKTLTRVAQTHKLNIHLGGIPWLIKGEVFNEALLITEAGEVVETYEKMHLFDVNLGPGIEVCESRSYGRGGRFGTFEIDGWKIATCICYDLRFPEIFIHYMENENVDAFLVPAAFTTKTGELHWKPLLQARAIETQAYILAPAQVGYHRDQKREKLRKSWGQSLVIGPWGKILHESSSYKQILDSNLTEHDPINTVMKNGDLENYRQSIPVKNHRIFRMELTKK